MSEIDELVEQFGEPYRELITDAIAWLNENEPKWKLRNHFNRENFIRDLILNIC